MTHQEAIQDTSETATVFVADNAAEDGQTAPESPDTAQLRQDLEQRWAEAGRFTVAVAETEPEAAIEPQRAKVTPKTQVKPPCHEMTDLFFGNTSDRPLVKRNRVGRAKVICAACVRQVSCREGAEERGERHGVWGGVDFERKAFLDKKLQRHDAQTYWAGRESRQ